MRTVIKPSYSDPPYSLHDAYVVALAAKGDTLHLATQYGYVRTTEPYGQVKGDIEITGVDWESSYVYLMEYTDVLCGNCGSFIGRKMTLPAFLQEFPSFSLDIMDESYGYCQANLTGFLNLNDRLLEFRLELYYTGAFQYILKE